MFASLGFSSGGFNRRRTFNWHSRFVQMLSLCANGPPQHTSCKRSNNSPSTDKTRSKREEHPAPFVSGSTQPSQENRARRLYRFLETGQAVAEFRPCDADGEVSRLQECVFLASVANATAYRDRAELRRAYSRSSIVPAKRRPPQRRAKPAS